MNEEKNIDPLEKMEWWRILALVICSAGIGASVGLWINSYYHLDEIIGIVAGIIIANAHIFIYLEMYKRFRIDEKTEQ